MPYVAVCQDDLNTTTVSHMLGIHFQMTTFIDAELTRDVVRPSMVSC